MQEFAQALSLADKVILADIYAARETDTLGISSANLRDLLLEKVWMLIISLPLTKLKHFY